MAWYAVRRRYVVEETAYVKAVNARHAKEMVAEGEFYDTDDPTIVRYMKPDMPERVNGIPRSMWEATGMPDDIPIRT